MSKGKTGYTKITIANTISAIMLQMVTMLIGLVLPKLYIVTYGSEVNGLVTSITQFISYFTIVEAGLGSACLNALYQPVAQNDTGKINAILAAIKKFYFQIGYIFSFLVVGFALLYPMFVDVNGYGKLDITILVIVLGLHGTIDFFTISKYRALLNANQKYYVFATASIIANVINFIVVYIAMKCGSSLILTRLLALTMYVLRSIIINIYVKLYYKYLDNNVKPDSFALGKRWDAMLLQLLGLAQNAMPVVILTFFSKDLLDVSVYAIYNLVASNIISILFTITNGVSATLGNVYALKDEEKFRNMYKVYELFFLMLTSIVYSCVLVMYIPFIEIYTTGIVDCEYIYPITAVLFALNGVLYNLKTPSGTLIGVAGVFKETKKGTIIQTIIAVVGCLVLTPIYGINGLLIGLILSNLYRDIELTCFMNKKVLNMSIFVSFKNMLLCLAVFGMVGLIFMLWTISASGYIEWAIQAVCVFVVAAIIAVNVFYLFNRTIFTLGIRKFNNFLKIRRYKS